MKTIHRRDLTAIDFDRLARFGYALQPGRCGHYAPIVLNTVRMRIPLWSNHSKIWTVAKFKDVEQEALGVSVVHFRRICRYLKVSEAKMIGTLFRFSILAVVPEQRLGDTLKFRQLLEGKEIDARTDDDWVAVEGFILERRRAEGFFRSPKA